MKKQINIQDILIKQNKLISKTEDQKFNQTKNAYYNAFLLSSLGIVVDKPKELTEEHVKLLCDFMRLMVPKSFYENPQDMKHFTEEELLVEQLVSYFYVESGFEVERIQIFKKDLPNYVVGDELVLRKFNIISLEEANKLAEEVMKNYCSYTRPLSIQENEEFQFLYTHGYYNNEKICCKENIISLLEHDITLARFLDKKDIVKMSINYFGEFSSIKEKMNKQSEKLQILKQALDFAQDCPMTKKQAKYYNKVCAICKKDNLEKATNKNSPDKLATDAMNNGDVLTAAKIYANNGSMLERHIKMLLSRANPQEMIEILEMLPSNNPIALYQMVKNLSNDDGEARIFTFYKYNRMKFHEETEYEQKWRKSVLNAATRKFLTEQVIAKIKNYYTSLPKLGKIYIDKNFYKIGVPTNTSASGLGLDVYPIGSRIPLTEDNIRAFVHWKNIYDVDYSIIVVHKDGESKKMDFTNYHTKPFGDKISFSGDVRSEKGAEYFDIQLKDLDQEGYKYVVLELHGYAENFDEGETFVGYQNKKDLETQAWDPKNIAMQYRVVGDSSMAMAFAIDVKTRELVIINMMIASYSRVANESNFKIIQKLLDSSYLEINMGMIAECRGELTLDPTEADVIFSDTYEPQENQIIYTSTNIAKLVELVNEKK